MECKKTELPDGSYLISDIQDYFEYILKKHGKKTINSSLIISVNKIETRIAFKIKTGYYLNEIAESIKSKITKDGNAENVPCLEITKVALVHYNIFNNN